MSIDPLGGGGGGEDEDELISLLRSCPSLSPPRSLLPFSSASPPDIWVTPWDPYTWTPPCSPQIDRAAAALLCQSTEILLSWLSKFSFPKGITFMAVIPWRRPKCSVRIRNLDDDGEEEEEETDYIFQVFIVKPYRRTGEEETYNSGPSELVHQQFKFTEDGELKYCIHCNKVFPSDTRLSDLNEHLALYHRVLVLLNLLAVYILSESSWGIPDIETALNLTKGGASNSRGLWEGCQSAWEAARGDEKPKEIDSQKSASRHVELPLAFDQSNTPPERMRVDNGKAAANTDALWIDAVQNCFEETTKADKPNGTWSAVWEHFVKIKIDDTEWADCKYCKKRFAGGSKEAGTSTLRRHLDKLHGIKIPKASSSKNKNSCGGPATSKSKTPTPSLLPSLAPVASKPPRTTAQRKWRTDGANDLATQEVRARGKRTRRRDNLSSSGVTPSEVPSSASTGAPCTGMVVASSQIALSAAGASGEVVRSIADTITNPGPKDLANAILLMSQAAEAVAREKMLLQEMEKLRQENADQATAMISRLEALEAKSALAADENKKLKAENTALRAQLQESPHSRPASPPSKRG